MCEPITISTALLYGSLALSAASTATTLVVQKKTAEAQATQQQQLVEANNAEASIQLSQLRIQQAQSRESSAREGEKARQASTKAKATAEVAAGEAGVSGNSVDAMLQEYSANLGEFKETATRQRQLEDSSFADREAAIRSGANYQNLSINAPVAQPNYAGAALSLGATALGTYKDYNPSSFQKKPVLSSTVGK